jgi:hypothetical protein
MFNGNTLIQNIILATTTILIVLCGCTTQVVPPRNTTNHVPTKIIANEEADFAFACKANTAHYRYFIKTHPQSDKLPEAQARLEKALEQEKVEKEAKFRQETKDREDRIALLKGYQIGQLTEAQFISDGWSCEAPSHGEIGFVNIDKSAGINKYVMGIYEEMDRNVLKDIVDVCNLARNTDALKVDIKGQYYTRVCDIHFSNGILTEVIWE